MRPVNWLFTWLFKGIVLAYRVTLSAWIGGHCRFQPTCSAYALEALDRHGAWTGGWLTLRRLSRCHPWGGSGYDPVPRCACRPSTDPALSPSD